MRRALTAVLLMAVLWALAGIMGARVLEYRDQIVTVTSEKGTRHFTARGLVLPVRMTHQSWTGQAEPGKTPPFARVDIQEGFYAKADVPVRQATIAGVVFPAVVIVVSLLWAAIYLRQSRSAVPASK